METKFTYKITESLGECQDALHIIDYFEMYRKFIHSILNVIYFSLNDYVVIYYDEGLDEQIYSNYDKYFSDKNPIILSDNIELAKEKFKIPNRENIYINTFYLLDLFIFSYFPNKLLNKKVTKLNNKIKIIIEQSKLYLNNLKYNFNFNEVII